MGLIQKTYPYSQSFMGPFVYVSNSI